jgi:kynurenine 3-monooxygenase
MRRGEPVTIVGAGLAGALLAVLLAQRGLQVRVFDRRPDPRSANAERGRSINLVLAARGLRALERAGLLPRIAPLLVKVSGRAVHEGTATPTRLPYGQQGEFIHSVSRGDLNRALIDAAAATPGVELRFGQQCLGVGPAYDTLLLRDVPSGAAYAATLGPTIATDGAGSRVRQSLVAAGLITAREERLDHDYKELTMPAAAAAPLARDALHIWPRGGFMLMALPNTDASFTATLFLAREGADGFATLRDRVAVQQFFAREFASALPFLPDYLDEFSANPQGLLGTVHCDRWHHGGRVLLLGDAAHAIVPFHGQGMNCAFEDCIELADLLESGLDWPEAFAEFERRRRPQAEAIAQMALENYIEMRDTVRDPLFQRRKAWSLELERRHPGRFIPRYSMVMFHAEIPYAEALRRGAAQEQLLAELDHGGALDDAVLGRAATLIEARLPPLPAPAR